MYYFRALSAQSKEPMGAGHIREVLRSMADTESTDLNTFQRLSDELVKTVAKKTQRWRVITPILLSEEQPLALPVTFRVFDMDFKIARWRYYQQLIDRERLIAKLEPHKTGPRAIFEGLCLTFWSRKSDAYNAWRNAEPVFDFLRGTIEITYGIGTATITSHPKPRARVPQGAWAVCIPDEGAAEHLEFILEDDNDKLNPLTTESVAALRKNCSFFRKRPPSSSMLAMLAGATRLSAQATDQRYDHQAFLGW